MNSAGIKNHIFKPFHLSFTIFHQNSGYLYITNPELHPKAFYMVFLSLPETDVGLAGDPNTSLLFQSKMRLIRDQGPKPSRDIS